MSLQDVLHSIFGVTQTLLLVWFLKKIEKSGDDFKVEFRTSQSLTDQRDDHQDELHSVVIGQRFNSKRVALGLDDFPIVGVTKGRDQ